MPSLFFSSTYFIIGFGIVFFVIFRINNLIQHQIEQQIQEEIEQAGGSIIEIKKLDGLGRKQNNHFEVGYIDLERQKRKNKVIVEYKRRNFTVGNLYWDAPLNINSAPSTPPADKPDEGSNPSNSLKNQASQ